MENIIYTLHGALHFISIAEIHGQQFDGKTAQAGRAAGLPNNAADLHVTLLDQPFNQPAADKSGRAGNKYSAPALQSRKGFIQGRLRIRCSHVPRLLQRIAPAVSGGNVLRAI
jgi:hypothetical protein